MWDSYSKGSSLLFCFSVEVNNFHHKPFIFLGILGCDSCSNLHKTDVTKKFGHIWRKQVIQLKERSSCCCTCSPFRLAYASIWFLMEGEPLVTSESTFILFLFCSLPSATYVISLQASEKLNPSYIYIYMYIKSLEVWDTKEYQVFSFSQEQCCPKRKQYRTSPKYSKKGLNGNRSIPSFLRCCPVGPDGSRESNWVSRMFETLH